MNTAQRDWSRASLQHTTTHSAVLRVYQCSCSSVHTHRVRTTGTPQWSNTYSNAGFKQHIWQRNLTDICHRRLNNATYFSHKNILLFESLKMHVFHKIKKSWYLKLTSGGSFGTLGICHVIGDSGNDRYQQCLTRIVWNPNFTSTFNTGDPAHKSQRTSAFNGKCQKSWHTILPPFGMFGSVITFICNIFKLSKLIT